MSILKPVSSSPVSKSDVELFKSSSRTGLSSRPDSPSKVCFDPKVEEKYRLERLIAKVLNHAITNALKTALDKAGIPYEETEEDEDYDESEESPTISKILVFNLSDEHIPDPSFEPELKEDSPPDKLQKIPKIEKSSEKKSKSSLKDRSYTPKGYKSASIDDDDDEDDEEDDFSSDDDSESEDSIHDVSDIYSHIPSEVVSVTKMLTNHFNEEKKIIDTSLKYGPLIGAIDEGTSSTRFLVFASKTAEVLTYHQVDIPSIVPQEGWFEQDPLLILEAVKETISVTYDNLEKLNIDSGEIAAVGITNQRETTVLWDPHTGKPLYNAIVWMDTRTSTTVDEVLKFGMRGQYFLQQACGLPVSTYFSALKIKWMMDNVPGIKEAMDNDRCLFGTIDSWLIWNLTGGVNGGIHITDYTNASRTMLMNIETLQWDSKLCEVFDIPMKILPEIRSCSEIYACVTMDSVLDGVPIAGILGDQQAALVGQMCFKNGQAKCTYGTGCFILYNTGYYKVISTHGLLTTVGYQFGPNGKPVYALEGSVAIAGIALKWLRDNLGILKNVADSTDMAVFAGTEGEVVFVPAFSGLYAPYWRQDARSVICGLTEETQPGHLVKAALEAVCFQVRDVLEAMTLDCKVPLHQLLVDGGMTINNHLLQMQSDYCGIPVVRPTMTETTSLGAAIAAGIAEGVAIWEIENILPVPCDTFQPQISDDIRDIKYSKWKMGIERSMGWDKSKGAMFEINLPRMIEWDNKKSEEKIAAAVPAGLFLLGAAAFIVVAEILHRNSRLGQCCREFCASLTGKR